MSKRKLFLASPNASNRVVASEIKTEDGARVIGDNGELNAHNKKELIEAISSLMEVATHNKVISENQALTEQESAKANREMLLAAFDSKEELAALGTMMAEELTIASNRDGFMRRLLSHQSIDSGQIPSARLRTKNVHASVATGPVQTNTQYTRDHELYPAEFYITARPFIEQKDIARANGDILEEKYVDALEAIMVSEDRTWKRMADDLVGLDNPHTTISGSLTPATFSNVTANVLNWGVVPETALIASDLWQDIVSLEAWSTTIDPVSKHELLLTGRLGTVHGLAMLSDHFRHPQHKVLDEGQIYIVGSPNQHGQYTDRGGVDSSPLDAIVEKVPGRGWYMTETMSMIIANSRSIARGKRV